MCTSSSIGTGDFPKTIFDGIAYMEADICVKQLNFPTGGSLENKQLYRAWQAFLYKNEKQLKLRKQNQALYLPVERTEMQNTMLTLFLNYMDGLKKKFTPA